MFQLINPLDMKEGEMYFVKKMDYIMEELIFVKFFRNQNNTQVIATFSYPYMSGYSNTWIDIISIYRYVTKNEYYMKLKEKYNQKTLDIVLKRLVDESFQW